MARTKHRFLLVMWMLPVIFAQQTKPLADSQILQDKLTAKNQQHYYFPLLPGAASFRLASSFPPSQNLVVPLSSSLSTKPSSSAASKKPAKSLAPRQLATPPQQTQKSLYITLSICSAPLNAPPLQLYISTTNDLPGPGKQDQIIGDGDPTRSNGSMAGVVNATLPLTGAERNVYIGVAAPEAAGGVQEWSYEISASSIAPAYQVSTTPGLILDDTDATTALFLTSPFSNTSSPRVSVYVLPDNRVPPALTRSLCAVNATANQQPLRPNMTETTRGAMAGAKYQAVVGGLAPGTSYVGYLVEESQNRRVMSQPLQFTTKKTNTCKLIFNLPFCTDVAYAVPAPQNGSMDPTALARAYDQNAQQQYQPFNTTMSQFNCDATAYSLVRNCTDCYRDYKTWLCSVTIPRCTESETLGVARNTNGSRNQWIDDQVRPPPYRELLPCIDLCYHVVQSCPPFLGFGCPLAGFTSNASYARWAGPAGKGGADYSAPTCNHMGQLMPAGGSPSGAANVGPGHFGVWVVTLLSLFQFML
ncbi:uncharacterized protein VTP21DRAFT_6949 [Calcarisporiella thermophila]|uniref:uncharacterized protein n=1 Tax=Calcarisporiella thermophila TaxID=911321 RepID=UPI003743DC99